MEVLTRSYDNARTGANTRETVLTPNNVGNNLVRKLFSLGFDDDDPRLEAQPLYVPGITMNDGKVHDVVYVCTMANNVWAFDATDGARIWAQPANLGRPIKPKATPFPGHPQSTEIDLWGINILWGILSTPVIDLETKTMYVMNWTSREGTVHSAVHQLHALDITDGHELAAPLTLKGFSIFSPGDFLDLSGLVNKLRTHADALSQFLWNRFSAQAQQVLANPNSTAEQQEPALTQQLNLILEGGSIFEDQRFAGVQLSPETVALKARNPQGADLVRLNRLLLEDGYPLELARNVFQITARSQTAPGQPAAKFVPSRQKQRAALLLTQANGAAGAPGNKTLFAAFALTREKNDPTHGWVVAFDLGTFRPTAAWCTTPNGMGSGIWQAGQGPAADENGDLYVMTSNYGVLDASGNATPPAAGDLPESFVKLHYTPPADSTAQGKLEAVAWFTPFEDSARNAHGDVDFQDYDLGSAGPVPIPGLSLVAGAGKDGVLYVLDKQTAGFGKGSDYSVLKQPPIFFTYFPGFGIDPSQVSNLDRLYDKKTHHLHGTPVYWVSPSYGPMLFAWGENESLRAWTLDSSGKVTFVAKSAEIASGKMGGKGGMPGGFPVVSSNGAAPNTGIIWATAPIFGDANRAVVHGVLRAYDATSLDAAKNSDGSPRLHLLWDSTHPPATTFSFSKFCPPLVADGKVFVATYDGRVDVYGLVAPPHAAPLPTNAIRMAEIEG